MELALNTEDQREHTRGRFPLRPGGHGVGAGCLVTWSALATGPPCSQLYNGQGSPRTISQGLGHTRVRVASLLTLGSLSGPALWFSPP